MKISNNFTQAIINNDLDERFTNGALVGIPKNVSIFTSNGNDAGVLKNVPGNVKRTDYANDINYTYAGAKTIGSGKNDSDEKIYHFVKATGFDYVIEFNTLTFQSTIILGSSTGGILNFKAGERITNVDIFIDAITGNVILFWSGDSNPPRCVNVETAKTWAIDGFTNDEISVMKPSPIFAPTITLTTSVDGVENNFIEDKMLCFSYRYKFSDGYYSAPSSWSKIAFTPKEFNLDYQTYENLGMLNLSNAVDVDFNVGPRDVVQVDLLFRESNNTTVYVIEEFVKSEQGWANDTIQTFQFSKSKIYTVLSEDQFFRNFDNVPLLTRAQSIIGNRIAYANFLEGRDLGVIIDFDVELITEEPFSSDIIGEVVNYDGVIDYSNLTDFEDGNADGGSSPIDQMNYATNTIAVNLAAAGADFAEFIIEVTPQAGYSLAEYTITVKEGVTVLQQWTALTGEQTKNYSLATNKNITIFVTSDEGIIYSMKLNYNLTYSGSFVSRWDYFSYFQLSFPKSGGYGATLVGDIVIDQVAEFDMTGYEFTAGKQIRINLNLQSSLVEAHTPSMTFFYNITNDYTDLNDFLTNPTSGFVYQLQTVFSQTFENNFQSGAGTFVSMTDFVVSQSGSLLQVKTPIIVYLVTEPSGVIENKNEFYLIDEADFQTVNENAFTSLHSNRDYEVGLIYMDAQGRKTTILNSLKNTIYVPAANSNLTNKLNVIINNNAPSWASYYKFAFKQVKKDYDIIYGNKVYTDGIYRWIKLEGQSKNKVNQGDLLIVKTDYSGPLEEVRKVKVLEVVTQSENFITGNVFENGDEIFEEAGLYFKIKQGNFNINITKDAFKSYIGSGKRRYASRSFVTTEPLFGFYDTTPAWVPDAIPSGTLINFNITIKAFGNISFNHTLNIDITAQDDYADMQAMFTAEIESNPSFTDYANNYLNDWQFTTPDGQSFQIKPWRDGTATRDIITTVEFNVNFTGGTLVFETEPIEQLNSPFFETPETYTVTAGVHEFTEHLLTDAFNCFAFGNGVESYKVRDSLVGKSFSIDSNPTDIDKEGYRQLNRYADITYSEIYNSNTNVNKLNEFNLSLANYKDDVEKVYGPIVKLKGKDTNLDVFQEDKVSIVYYGKDLLFNADGNTNLTGVPQVLGQQKTYPSENGISQHPLSYDDYGTNDYFTDVKRGVVIKKNESNGIFPISDQGMRSYFKELFRDNVINHIKGTYDQYYDLYILNIQMNTTDYITWIYSDKDNGWLSTQRFNPEDMVRVNGNLYSFKNGEIFVHNQEFNGVTPNYNKFYGVSYDSEASFNFSQEPSTRKQYKTIEIEGSIPLQIGLTTDLDSGYINLADFEKKEGNYYAHVRYNNGVVNTELLSFQGIGNCTVAGLVLEFNFEIDPIISVGDVILNQNLQIVGTIISKTSNSLTLNSVANIVTGGFVLASKPNSVQQQGILGYYMKVDLSFSSNTRQEIFAVNSEVVKSFM
jgi:hypothetical protein